MSQITTKEIWSKIFARNGKNIQMNSIIFFHPHREISVPHSVPHNKVPKLVNQPRSGNYMKSVQKPVNLRTKTYAELGPKRAMRANAKKVCRKKSEKRKSKLPRDPTFTSKKKSGNQKAKWEIPKIENKVSRK